jgi:hypothetical protein
MERLTVQQHQSRLAFAGNRAVASSVESVTREEGKSTVTNRLSRRARLGILPVSDRSWDTAAIFRTADVTCYRTGRLPMVSKESRMGTGRNPYPANSHNHKLWEDWNDRFFDQAISSQVLHSEGNVRDLIRRLARLGSQIDDPSLKREVQALTIELEEEANLLEGIAEHAHIEIVTRSS